MSARALKLVANEAKLLLIGIPVLMATFVWYIIRNVKGLIRASQDEPIPDPKSWLIGA